MGSTRIKGNIKPVITLGSPGSDFSADLLSYIFENEEADSDTITFEDAASGGARQWYMRGEAIQSLASASFWEYVWANSGEEVAFVVAPFGNAVASATQKHFTGTLKIGPKPNFGGEANTSSTAAFTFEFEFELIGEPVPDDGS